jgi:hypothetical protein
MSTKRAAAASEAHVARAARDALARGNAVDAVIAGLLVAAAESPAVLLGPVQLLVGGGGAGLLAVDGRVHQPGLGAQRPRGVVVGDAVPASARVGVSAFPAAVATALGSLGRSGLLRVAGPAIEHARALSPERAAVIERFARLGAAVLTDERVAVELMAAAGRASGGALTRDDLAEVRPTVEKQSERSLGASGILRAPWLDAGAPPGGSATHTVAAADAQGLVAIACYEAPVDGLPVPALGLVAPLVAAPVMRGEVRARPGEPCPAIAAIALRARKGLVDLAIGVAGSADAESSLAAILGRLGEAPTIAEALAGASGRPVAVVRTRDAALAVASS